MNPFNSVDAWQHEEYSAYHLSSDVGLSPFLNPYISTGFQGTYPTIRQLVYRQLTILVRRNPTAAIVPNGIHNIIRRGNEPVSIDSISTGNGDDMVPDPVDAEFRLKDGPVGGSTMAIIPVGGMIVVERDQVTVRSNKCISRVYIAEQKQWTNN